MSAVCERVLDNAMVSSPCEMRARHVSAQLQANAWLQTELIKRFRELAAKDPFHKNQSQACEGLLTGRLLRPVLRHLYLLGYYPLNDQQLRNKADLANYDFAPLHYHYRRNEAYIDSVEIIREFPQAFLVAFLVNSMKGDIGRGSASSIIVLFTSLGLLQRVSCIRGSNGFAVSFGRELRVLVETWIDRSIQA